MDTNVIITKIEELAARHNISKTKATNDAATIENIKYYRVKKKYGNTYKNHYCNINIFLIILITKKLNYV